MEEIIRVENLTHTYGEGTPFCRSAVQDMSLAIYRGEFLGIIGHTGSGKSTLIQHLNGLLKPTSGRILLGGEDIWSDPKKIRDVRFRVGLVFQYPEYQLFEETVYRDIAFGPTNMGLSKDEIDRRVRESAHFAGLTDDLLEKSPFALSGGQKRRVAIAGVIAMEPEVLVLDEADRMLDMGFIHDVTRILDKLASRRNLGMFSATISREVMDISWMYQRDPEEITVQAKEENKPDIAQYRIDVGQNDKAHVMAQIIRAEGHERVMAFCNTKGMTERLKAFLMMEGLEADCIHGDIPQKKREAVMARFRRGELPIFVATDVAARGIDVDDVDAVFNYDVPLENEYYVHRIGRTGRAKRRGVAYTLVSDYPSGMRLDGIAKFTGNEVKKAHLDAEGKLVED